MTAPADTAAFLRLLVRDGFVPAERDADALAAGGPKSAARQAADFAAEVAAFAADYWNYAPATRRKRWADLSARAFGPAAAWLAELEAGLAIAPAPQPDTPAAAVADLARELYALPPAARAARRLTWFGADDRRAPGWVAAARTVLRTDAPLTRLEPRLFDWFSLGLVPRPTAADPDAPALPSDHLGPPVYADPTRPAPQPARAFHEPAMGSGCGWSVGLFVVVAILRFLFLGGGSNSAPKPPAPPRPEYRWQAPPAPAAKTFPEEWLDKPFTAEQVKSFQDYERAVEARGGKAAVGPPARYACWVELGRPTGTPTP